MDLNQIKNDIRQKDLLELAYLVKENYESIEISKSEGYKVKPFY